MTQQENFKNANNVSEASEAKFFLQARVFEEMIKLYRKITKKNAQFLNTLEPPLTYIQSRGVIVSSYIDNEEKEKILEVWVDYLHKFNKVRQHWDKALNEYLERFDLWETLFHELIAAKTAFQDEYKALSEKLTNYHKQVSDLKIEEAKNWNKEQLEREASELKTEILKLSAYLLDLHKLVEDKLIGRAYGYQTKKRKTRGPHLKVLRENGFE